MRKFTLIVVTALTALLCAFYSCSSTPSTGSSSSSAAAQGDIEIMGSWVVTNIDLTTGTNGGTNGCEYVISNGSFACVYHPWAGWSSGTIAVYNNTLDYLVVYITNDTLYGSAPYYEKIGWKMINASNFVLYAYEATNSAAAAEANTNLIWGPVSNCLSLASQGDLELLGVWLLTNIDLDTGTNGGAEDCEFALSNESYFVDYIVSAGESSGIMVKYNNHFNYFIVCVTNDSIYGGTPYYEKVSWQFVTPSNFIMRAYGAYDNFYEAEVDTNMVWGPASNCIKQ